MSLAHDAANDWREIMQSDIGASWDCTVISPAGISAPFLCRVADISQQVNATSDEIAMGRQIVISIVTQDLIDAGFSDVRGIEHSSEKPWKVYTDDINGVSGTYKVTESNPDRSIGNMVLWLEVIK